MEHLLELTIEEKYTILVEAVQKHKYNIWGTGTADHLDDAVLYGVCDTIKKAQVYVPSDRENLEKKNQELRDKLGRIRDWFRYQANSLDGVVAEIDNVLYEYEECPKEDIS